MKIPFHQACGRIVACCFVLMLLMLLPLGALARSDNGTPEATMLPPTLDLAAMTLTPNDLFAAGLPGFGYDATSVRDFETEVEVTRSNSTNAERVAFRAKYETTGFQRRVTAELFRPALPLATDERGATEADLNVMTSITEYATPKGATAGFNLVEDESDNPQAKDLGDVRTFGDQSEITSFTLLAEEPTESDLHGLNLSYRLGNLTADVIVIDFTGQEPEVSLVEKLGDRLQDRIERVRAEGAPGLSNQILRLTPIGGQIANNLIIDRYDNIGGDQSPTYYEMVGALQGGKSWEEASAEWVQESTDDTPLRDQPAAYQFFAYFRNNESTDSPTTRELERLGYVYVTLYQEVSVEGAELAFTNLLNVFDEGGGVGLYQLDPDVPDYGDESFAAFQQTDDRLLYAFVARVGKHNAYIFISTSDAERTDVAAVADEMIAAQVECLTTPRERCAAVEMPESLLPPERPTLSPPGQN